MNVPSEAQQRDTTGVGVFVSHITEEAHLAHKIKQHLEAAIDGARVFVSAEDIRLGEDWRRSLREALDDTKALVVLCSPRSIKRPWINFESGSGWLRGVRVIPVCHSGLRKADLPDPLRAFQVLELVDDRDCQRLVEGVGAALKRKATENYPYGDMIESLFKLPERGDRVGVVLTHRQSEWDEAKYTLFNLSSALPERLTGRWSFSRINKTDDLLSASLHAYAGLIVGTPWRCRMEPEVVAALADFVMKGGRMLMLGFEMGDRHHGSNLNDLAAQFGIYFEADIVGPPGQQESKPYDVAVDFNPSSGDPHKLMSDIHAIRLANVQTLRVLPLGREWLRVGPNVACRPSRETVTYRDGTFSEPGREGKVEPNSKADWLPVAAEAPEGLCGCGAVQAIGTWDLLGRTRAFNHRENLVLLGRLFEWLCGRDITDSFTVSD
jgi:hypothetical protein